jgi:hypothetical protein
MLKDVLVIIITVLFICFELALYLFMHLAHFVSPIGIIAIGTCLVYSAIFCVYKKGIFLVGPALIFGFIADYILMFLDSQAQGVTFFACAQLVYFIETLRLSFSVIEIIINIIVRILAIVGLEVGVYCAIKENFHYLEGIAAFYYSNFVINVIFSIVHFKTNFLFPLGLFFFLICDTFITLDEMDDVFSFTGWFIRALLDVDVNMAWIFYVPSQVILTLGILLSTPLIPTNKCKERFLEKNKKSDQVLQIND